MAEQLVQEWLQAGQADNRVVEEERVVTELSGSLDLGTITFPEFIRSITSRVEQEPDLTIAGRGLSLLPRVLTLMQAEPTRNDVHALVPYLCVRLEDASPGVYYISESLQTISTWKRFPPGDAQEVARAIFKLGASNNFSSQTAITRLSLYELAESLRNTHPNTLKRDMTIKEFVKGVVTMAELEKNPSCLRALFKLYADLSQQWALEADDLKLVFDSYIRYFPVTMKDAPKDPSIPSTAELRDLLLKCFVSSDGYSKMTFEAMVDRLDVDSANTKVEVFKTLEQGVKLYSVSAVSESATKLWDTLKFEIWNGDNEDWIQSSLNLLKELAASLDRIPCDWLEKDNPMHKFVVGALAECRDRIKDKPNTYLASSGRIFRAIASACPYAFYLVAKFAVPILDTLHQAQVAGPEKVLALEALNGILAARLKQVDVKPLPEVEFAAKSPELQEYQLTSESHMTNGFSVFRDRIVEIYHEDVSQVKLNANKPSDLSYGVPAIKGLVLIFSVPSYLSESEKGVIVGDLVEIALKTDQVEDIREESLSALGTLSGTEPALFQSIVLPAILAKLPNKVSTERAEKNLELAVSLLESLVRIGATPASTVINRQSNFVAMQGMLIQRLVETIPHHGQLKFQHAILASISAWFEATSSDSPKPTNTAASSQQSLDGRQFAPVLMLLSNIVQVKHHGLQEHVGVIDTADETLIRLSGEYVMRALRDVTTTQTNNFLIDWDQTHPGFPSAIWTLFTAINQPDFVMFQSNLAKAPKGQCLANALSMYLIAGSRREDMKLLKEKFDVVGTAATMLSNAIVWNPVCSSFARTSILHFIQLLVNKFGAAKQPIGEGGKTLLDIMSHAIELAPEKEKEVALNIYQTLAYFAAASLAALDPSTSALIQFMLDSIKTPIYGRKVAQSFRLLLSPSEILTRENFCFIRPLRKGRLYELAVKPLIVTWRTSQDLFVKENALVALVGILAFLEPAMLADNAKDILPVLLEGTNIQDDNFAKETCIKGILDIIPLSPLIIEEHLNSVIDRMTDRTHNTYNSPSDSSVRCRAIALEVLLKLTEHVKPTLLLKRKPVLVRELDFALEDCSSEVRHRAERCKMAWFNMVDAE